MLRTSLSTDSSTRAAQIVVEFDGVNAGGGGGSKSVWQVDQKIVKKLKNGQKVQKALKVWKICKGHWFRGKFTKTPIFCQLDTKNSSFR